MGGELVEELRATPCIPRKPSAEFQRFPVSATGDKRRFSRAELRGHPEHIHYITWCGAVLLHDSVANPEARQGLPALDSVSEASGSAMAMRTPSSFKGRFRDGEDMPLTPDLLICSFFCSSVALGRAEEGPGGVHKDSWWP